MRVLWQNSNDLEEAVYRIGNSAAAVALSCLHHSALSYEGRKISPFLCKIFNYDPQFLHVFGRAHLVYNCVL